MLNDCDQVDVDGFEVVVDGSDAPRRSLPSNPRDTVFDPSHSEGAQLKDEDELHNTKDQLVEAKMFLEAYARELKRTRAEMRQMAQHINDLEQRLKGAEQRHESELSIVRRELQDAKDLASISGKDFVGVEVFRTVTADAPSISQVVVKVNTLNEEILEAAALMGEGLIHNPHAVPQEVMDYALGIAQGVIDSRLINILRQQSRKELPLLIVQVVLQVFLVNYCSQLVHSWSNDKTCANHLAAIYSRIRDKEEQAVSSRWRSLTRNHTRPSPGSWRGDFVRKLGAVVRVAGWMAPSVEKRDAFGQKLEPIFRAVEDLRNTLGEKFTSADLEVSVVEAGRLFVPAYMEDAYGDPDGKYAPQEVVVATTGIGLKKVMVKPSARGQVTFENVLSAKVVLESTLLEALDPPPRGKTGKQKVIQPSENVLPPLPKGAAVPKPTLPAAATARGHQDSSQLPTTPPKTDQTSVKLTQQQRRPPPEWLMQLRKHARDKPKDSDDGKP